MASAVQRASPEQPAVAASVVDDRPLAADEIVSRGVRLTVPRGWVISRGEQGVLTMSSGTGTVLMIGADPAPDAATFQSVRLQLILFGLAQNSRYSNEQSAPQFGPSARQVRMRDPERVAPLDVYSWIGQTRDCREIRATCSGGRGAEGEAFCDRVFARLSTRAPTRVAADEMVINEHEVFAVVSGLWRRDATDRANAGWTSGEAEATRAIYLDSAPGPAPCSLDADLLRQTLTERGLDVRHVRAFRAGPIPGYVAHIVRPVTLRSAVVHDVVAIHHNDHALTLACARPERDEAAGQLCQRLLQQARLVSRGFERSAPDPFAYNEMRGDR